MVQYRPPTYTPEETARMSTRRDQYLESQRASERLSYAFAFLLVFGVGALVAAGLPKPDVAIYALEHVDDAFATSAAGHVVGKLVISVSNDTSV